MNLTRKFATDSILLIGATLLAQFASFVSGTVVKRLLGPADVGAWAMAYAVLSYAVLGQFGVQEAILMEAPARQERQTQLNRLVGAALSWQLFAAAAAAVLIAAYVGLAGGGTYAGTIQALSFAVIMIAPFHMVTLGVTIARASGDFRRVALGAALNGVSSAAAMVPLVRWLGLPGQAIGFGIGLGLQLAVVAPWRYARIDWNVRVHEWMLRLVRLMMLRGFTVQAGSALMTVRQSIDAVIAVLVLGPQAGGVYALAVSFRTYLVVVPTAFGSVLFRVLRQAEARGGEKRDDGQPFWRRAMLGSLLLLVLPGCVVLASAGPPLARLVFPNFPGADRLIALVSLAAAGMMLEVAPLQRIVASADARRFRWVAGIAAATSTIAALAGVVVPSASTIVLSVAVASALTLGVMLHFAVQLDGTGGGVRRLVAPIVAAYIIIGGFVVCGWLSAGNHLVSPVALAASGLLTAVASFALGAYLGYRGRI